MSDDWGLLDKDGDAEACCSECENTLDWVECSECGGAGDWDAYEDNPNEYAPGTRKVCALCGGAGGWYWCWMCKRID